MHQARKAVVAALIVVAAHAARAGRDPLHSLPPELLAPFTAGQAQFETEETPASGLGPVFNAPSCATCHAHPATGGASATFVTRFGRTGERGFDPMPERGGPVIEVNGIVTDRCAVSGESVPPGATRVARRNTPPLFGLGLVDSIPDRAILRLARVERAGGEVRGRPNPVHGRVGRFGWKAQVVGLRQFTASAYLNEIGITSPDFPTDLGPQGNPVVCDPAPDPEDDGTRIDAVTRFLLLLPPRPRVASTPEARAGSVAFHVARCDACHATRLRVGPTHPIAAARGRRIPMFSDLLLHDMGFALADGIAQGFATGSDFRTPPLWDLRDSAPYLHDGRAATIEEAILAHAGEADPARRRFLALSARKRAAVVAFLRSL